MRQRTHSLLKRTRASRCTPDMDASHATAPKPKRPRYLSQILWNKKRSKGMVYIGDSFEPWRRLKADMSLKTDAHVAHLLLQSYEKLTGNSILLNNTSVSSDSKSSVVAKRVCSSENTTHATDEEQSQDNEACASLFMDEKPEPCQDSTGHCVETMNTLLCPSCGCTFQIQNVSDCVSAQLCLQCEYRNKFIKQINRNEHQPGSIEVTIESEAEPEATEDHVSDSEAPAQSKESDISDEEDTVDIGDVSSDEDWIPKRHCRLQTGDVKNSDSEEDGEELCEEELSSHGHRNRQLCSECGAFYYLKAHTCVHKTKPYVCNVCGKRCVTELSLKVHSNIHNESYEHPCKYCHVTFKTKKDKLAHEEIHQNTENPYKCPDCPETFASNKRRRIHLKSHGGPKEHKCDICGIRFWRKCHLKRHMIIHKGVKPFECSVCQRTFNQAGHLKSHMRLHTGEKPYKCTHCEESFNHNVSLKSHLQRYHTFDLGDLMDEHFLGSCSSQDHSDTGADCVKKILKEQDTEQIQKEHNTEQDQKQQDTGQVKQERVKAKYKRFPPSGRPVGRPKRNGTDKEDFNTAWLWWQNVNNVHESNTESEKHFTDINSFYLGQEEEREREQTVKKGTYKYKDSSDSEYDPYEETKKPSSRGQSTGRPRGRPRKTANV